MKKLFLLGLSFSIFLLPILTYADSIVISPPAFMPFNHNVLYESGWSWLNVESGSSTNVFMAPVYLPNGAQITSVVVFYTDVSATGNLQVQLIKYNIYTDSANYMAQWTSSTSSASYENVKLSPIYGGAIVDNGGYAYIVRCYFSATEGDNIKLHKVKINYN